MKNNIKRASDGLIGGRFKVLFDKQADILSTRFADYYHVQDQEPNSSHAHNSYVAVVYKNVILPTIVKHLQSLINASIKGVVRPVCYEILESNNHANLVAIIPAYDRSKSLSKMLESGKALDEALVINKILPSMLAILKFYASCGICCGNINPDNILLVDGEALLLETFASLPNAEQHNYYLAPEISGCVYYGRNSDYRSDIYALGMLAYQLLVNKSPWDEYSPEEFTFMIIDRGAASVLNSSAFNKSHKYYRLISGMLDGILARPKIDDILLCLEFGKHIPAVDYGGSIGVIHALGRAHHTLSSLAYTFGNNWQQASDFVFFDNAFAICLKKIGSTPELSDQASKIASWINVDGIMRGHAQSHLSVILTILDPLGPIRCGNMIALSAHSIVDALSVLCVQRQYADSQAVLKVIQDETWSFCKTISQTDQVYRQISILRESGKYTDVLKDPYRTTCNLNPYMHFIYSGIENLLAFRVVDFFAALNGIASARPNQVVIDKAMVDFVASRMDCADEMEKAMSRGIFADIASNELYMLWLISRFNKANNNMDLKAFIGLLLKNAKQSVVHYIKNKNNRVKVAEIFDSAAQGCQIDEMLSFCSDDHVKKSDLDGYELAKIELNKINRRIAEIDMIKNNMEYTTNLWQKLTTILSYIVCLIFGLIVLI